MVARKLSRLESNKEIRRALVKCGADMSKVNYSCHGRSLTLSGSLYKTGGSELSSSNVECLLQDINRLGLQINCDLENWNISEGSISKKNAAHSKGQKESKKSPVPRPKQDQTKAS